jgi:hypothetical protein
VGLCGMVVATAMSVLYRSVNRKSISGERRASTRGSQLRRTPLHCDPQPSFAASVLPSGDSVYEQSTGQTPECHVPEAGSNLSVACQCGCARQSLHSLPRFASVLHLLPLYASERNTRPKSPTMRNKEFRNTALPLYDSRSATL